LPAVRQLTAPEKLNLIRILAEDLKLTAARKTPVTILEDAPATGVPVTALLSEQALAKDWDRPEEDEAWSHL